MASALWVGEARESWAITAVSRKGGPVQGQPQKAGEIRICGNERFIPADSAGDQLLDAKSLQRGRSDKARERELNLLAAIGTVSAAEAVVRQSR